MNPPPQMPPSFHMMKDAEHLKLLSVFHFVLGGLSVLGILFGGFYIFMGTLMADLIAKSPASSAPGAPPSPGMPAEVKWIFIGYGVAIMLVCLCAMIGHLLCGKYLLARKNRTFCLVVGGLSCLMLPLGTVLGIFTILVLMRPSVGALFDGPKNDLPVPY